jgi:lipoyl synthase
MSALAMGSAEQPSPFEDKGDTRRLFALRWEELQGRAWAARTSHFAPWLGLALPGPRHYATEHYVNEPQRFASVSLTGKACALNCAHCSRHLLETMYGATTPTKLVTLGRRLQAEGCQGMLISGGADAKGAVPLGRFLPAIAKLKGMGLQVIVHTGLTDEQTARGLHDAGIDQALFDVIGDKETIRQVYGLPYGPDDYARGLETLRRAGLPVAPHVVIGLYFGQLRGELAALEIIRRAGAEMVVLVVLRPLPKTPMARVTPPSAEAVGRLTAVARLSMPGTPLMLGCARPAGLAKVPMERLAVLAGVNVVAYPDPETVRLAAEIGLETGFLESCCTLVDAKRLR